MAAVSLICGRHGCLLHSSATTFKLMVQSGVSAGNMKSRPFNIILNAPPPNGNFTPGWQQRYSAKQCGSHTSCSVMHLRSWPILQTPHIPRSGHRMSRRTTDSPRLKPATHWAQRSHHRTPSQFSKTQMRPCEGRWHRVFWFVKVLLNC